MQYNNHPQEDDIVSDINFWCSTDSITYPIKDKTRNANFALARVSARIMRFDRNWKHVSSNATTIPVAVQDLVAGQDNYTMETKHLKVLRVRVMGSDGKMKTLTPTDRSKATDDLLNATGEPTHYDKIGASIMPLPIPNYSAGGGIEIEYQPGAADDLFDVLDETKEPGFSSDYHRLISLEASEDYCALHNRDRLIAIREAKKEIYDDMEAYYESRDIDDEPAFAVQNNSKAASLLG